VVSVATAKKRGKFDPKTFLSTIDGGRTIAVFPKKHLIFVQGDPADAVFYIQEGRVKLTVVAKSGKEATILRRRLSCGAAVPHVLGKRDDGLFFDAHREEVHDASDSPGTCVFRYVRGVFADAEHPIRGGFS
jgi:CRP-like cAMP-binding protein